MKVNIQEMLKECGVEESFYPGKRIVSRMPQTGENKSHCVIYDWRAPETLRVEVKAGLHGANLTPKELSKYPISFQTPTFFEVDASANENDRVDEEDEDGDAKGKSGGGKKVGGKKPTAFDAFSRVVEGKIPDAGDIKKMVVMGKTIAKEAYATVLNALTAQIREMKITPVNILAEVTKIIKVAPGGRALSDIKHDNPALLEGVKRYEPKDMFGASPS